MGIHKVQRFLDGVLSHNGIRVQQQDIVAVRLSDSNIVGTSKADIVVTGDELYLGELFLNHLYRVIVRVVIDHIHLGADSFQRTTQRQQALFEVATDIIAYDDNC